MAIKKQRSSKARSVEITILPSNVALVRPRAEDLRPLWGYENFLIADDDAERPPDHGETDDPPFSSCSAFPAGLIARLQAALEADGFRVAVDDRRRFERHLRVNQDLCQKSYAEERALLRALRTHPLGQLEFQRWSDMVQQVEYICRLYPTARTLIVVDTNSIAQELQQELCRRFLRPVGLLAHELVEPEARRRVSTLAWLPRLRSNAWDVLLLIAFNSRALSATTYQGVLRLVARRVYTLVGHGLRLAQRTRLRLEAMAGPMIAPLECS